MKLCRPITLLSLLVFISISVRTPPVQAQEPVIAPEIGKVIAEEGLDSANQRFAELMASESLDYTAEMQGLMTLMSAYMQAGNEEAAGAVGEMYAHVMQQMMTGASNGHMPGMAEAHKAEEQQRNADEEAGGQLQQNQFERSRGKSRDDLERFKGLYSDPDSNDASRAIFVAVSCDGYLVTGPMWADVGPWWMRSAGDGVFTYADSWTNLSFEFVGKAGRGMRLNHDVEGAVSPLENKGPLPDDWDECIERPRR